MLLAGKLLPSRKFMLFSVYLRYRQVNAGFLVLFFTWNRQKSRELRFSKTNPFTNYITWTLFWRRMYSYFLSTIIHLATIHQGWFDLVAFQFYYWNRLWKNLLPLAEVTGYPVPLLNWWFVSPPSFPLIHWGAPVGHVEIRTAQNLIIIYSCCTCV